MSITIHDLEMAQNSINTPPIKQVVDRLLDAINDWPNEVRDLNAFELEIQDFIGGITDKQNIEKALKKMDLSKDAWRAESLSGLIELYGFYDDGLSLKEIIKELTKEIS